MIRLFSMYQKNSADLTLIQLFLKQFQFVLVVVFAVAAFAAELPYPKPQAAGYPAPSYNQEVVIRFYNLIRLNVINKIDFSLAADAVQLWVRSQRCSNLQQLCSPGDGRHQSRDRILPCRFARWPHPDRHL